MKKNKIELTSFHLHLMAMFFMFLDHSWATLIPDNQWMTNLGRIAFPLYAFMIVEGFTHTSNLKKYVKRLFVLAVLSEIPFNYMMMGSFVNPFQQNVIWTFLIGILAMYINEKNKDKSTLKRILAGIGSILVALVLGTLAMTDYGYAGVLVILTFYFLREKSMQNFLLQFLILGYIYSNLMGGLEYEYILMGKSIYFNAQVFALLAQIPIWLYNGKQGKYNKTLQRIYYSFYPVHMIILTSIATLI